MFRIGQKVVCVNAEDCAKRPRDPNKWDGVLRKGTIYQIRWVGKYGVKLVGIDRTRTVAGVDYADTYFWASRFRPLATRKTDISIFTEMLGPQRELAVTSQERREP